MNLNNTVNQLDLTDIYNTLPNSNSIYILLKGIWDSFRIDYILGHQ